MTADDGERRAAVTCDGRLFYNLHQIINNK